VSVPPRGIHKQPISWLHMYRLSGVKKPKTFLNYMLIVSQFGNIFEPPEQT